ncbi:hypothetical protein, partial [Phormidium sp. CCY1219]|uniref:hypothetical protein n=1 Tax=Phormidium sp. CCY1219 TaxID=2886104 RepID=UPI002D1EE85C
MNYYQFFERQIAQIRQGGIKVVKRKLFSIAKKILTKIVSNPLSTYLLITFFEQVISSFPQSQWAYKQILRLLQPRFAYDSNPDRSAKKFLEYFLPYLELSPESILEWRLTAYSSYWLLGDSVGLQKMMQTYMDTQKYLAK